MNTTTVDNWEGFLVILGAMIAVAYYSDLIGSVLRKEITKHRFFVGLIPFMVWVLIFLEQFEQLEK